MDKPVNGLSLAMLSPKDKSWQDKKLLNETISQLYSESQYEKYSARLTSCANYLTFKQWANNESGEVKLKLNRVFLCKVRHCPCCSWSRSRVWKRRLCEGMPKMMTDYPSTRFIFLTLTVPNCHISELRKTLQGMSKAFDKLMQRRGVKNNVLGYVRSMEVTRNAETGYAHPHFHVLLAVKPSYFGKGYITQATWVSYWQESLGTIENRIVDVRAIKPNPKYKNDPLGLASSILEVAKYCVKHTDMIVDRDWLIEMTTQLNATKHVVLGGLIKRYVNSSEPSEEDILKGHDEENEEPENEDLIFFYWNKWRKDYLMSQNRTV
jgi:plasmid rolling circle replication initiator protein Rep